MQSRSLQPSCCGAAKRLFACSATAAPPHIPQEVVATLTTTGAQWASACNLLASLNGEIRRLEALQARSREEADALAALQLLLEAQFTEKGTLLALPEGWAELLAPATRLPHQRRMAWLAAAAARPDMQRRTLAPPVEVFGSYCAASSGADAIAAQLAQLEEEQRRRRAAWEAESREPWASHGAWAAIRGFMLVLFLGPLFGS